MGHFSLHCCLSGIPINEGAPVAGWHLQPTKFKELSCERWLPLTFPVVGTYDGYGRIENGKGDKLTNDNEYLALCHQDLWDELPSLWDSRDGGSMQKAVEDAHKEFLERRDETSDMRWRKSPYWDAHSAVFQRRYPLTWLTNLCLGEPAESDGKPSKETEDWGHERHCGPFEKLLLDLVISGPMYLDFRETCGNLEKLLGAYTSTIYRGKPIIPTEATHAVQDSDYKIEKKWFSFVSAKLTALRKEEIERDKEHKREMAEWEAKEN